MYICYAMNQCCTLAALDHKMSRTLMHVHKTANLTFCFWCTRIVRIEYSRNGWLNEDLSASHLKSDGRWKTETLAFRVELGTELRVSLHHFFASSRSIFLILFALFHMYFFRCLFFIFPDERHEYHSSTYFDTFWLSSEIIRLIHESFITFRWMFKLLND